MPNLTTFKITKPNVHRLTIDSAMIFPVIFFYEMRGGGGGAGGGANVNINESMVYKKGGNGWHGTKTYGQIILNPGDTLFLCPGAAGKKGASSVNSNYGGGLGGQGTVATINGTTYRFAGGNGGNASSSGTSHLLGAGGGGGGASVIIVHRVNNVRQIISVAAGGGGGGGGAISDSITSDRPYIGSLTNATNGGGAGQTHGDSTTKNYRYGSYLGFNGAGAGGGGGGAISGDGGLIDFYEKPSFAGSAGTSYSSRIVNNTTIDIITSNVDSSPPGGLESQLGGNGGIAAQVFNGADTNGDDGYIIGYMYTLNTIRYKEGQQWVMPDSFYYKIDQAKWSTIRKMFYKRGSSRWRKFYDIDVYYELVSSNNTIYDYGASTQPAVEKENEPVRPPKPAQGNPICISVIDETSISSSIIQKDWNEFRKNYPFRKFVLLYPGKSSARIDLKIPSNYDGTHAVVNRDNLSSPELRFAQKSDWFDIADLKSLPVGGVVSLSVDNSGSMTTKTVKESYEYFKERVAAAGLQLVELTMVGENWIKPHNVSLPEFIIPPKIEPVVSSTAAPNKNLVNAAVSAAFFDGGGSPSESAPSAPGDCSPSPTSCSADGGGGGECFSGDTMITMSDGSLKNIKEIVVGDYVVSADGKSVNQVKYIEHSDIHGTSYKTYYAPKGYKPFATINHPLYINGTWYSANKELSDKLYPWIKTEKLEEFETSSTNGETVWNLWVDGDHTYQVNGFGTSSLVDDGGWLRLSVEYGYMTKDEITQVTHAVSNSSSVVAYGCLLWSNLIGRLEYKWLVKYVADMMKGKKSRIPMDLAIIVVGKIAMIINKIKS